MPHETVAILAQVLCTLFNHAWVCSVVSCKATHVGCTCQQFWQNDQKLSHVAVVTWGCNRYGSKGLHRKLTLEKKILPLLLLGLKTVTLSLVLRAVSVPDCHLD